MKKDALLLVFIFTLALAKAQNTVPIIVEANSKGAPITVGVPFPKQALYSPDHIRLLNSKGIEIPSQVTEVSTWAPADQSIKWIWLFFFSQESSAYTLEFGPGVVRAPYEGPTVEVINNQRSRGFIEVNTGKLKLRVNNGENGFINRAYLDVGQDGFTEADLIASGDGQRGSFLDLLDDAGLDQSRAVITRTIKEKGSGPLHSIIRIEGEYRYEREDNNVSPFVTRIHTYAGKSYIRVLHTITYTGVPDKHRPVAGEHKNIATQNEQLIEEYDTEDPGWMKPNDLIASAGLCLHYHLEENKLFSGGYREGSWGGERGFGTYTAQADQLDIIQLGPAPFLLTDEYATESKRTNEFEARFLCNGSEDLVAAEAEGWMDYSDEKWGVATGIKNFVQEYPKGFGIKQDSALIYLWPPNARPMSFARSSTKLDGEMLDNFAQGLAKTTEITYNFHTREKSQDQVKRELDYFLNAPAPHTSPQWYSDSEAFGKFAPREDSYAEYERGLDYKFDWVLYNQSQQPWYGMFDYGDFKTHYQNKRWYMWANNEPAQDFMFWLQFMRTGEQRYFRAADAASKHTMDVDNIHWPASPRYNAATNDAVVYWDYEDQAPGTPYLGIGRRHASQHWISLLSAHVWIQGWIAAYYLNGYHRGLEVARQTGDAYIRRIWGEHGLTGRRLYLSVWNLVELYDATKEEKYWEELGDRVDMMLELQKEPDQYQALVMDRYGYSQVYASHGLSQYYRVTGDEQVKNALVRHARAIRDNAPWNHLYESYLSSIHSLLLGYEYTNEPSFLRQAIKRAKVLQTGILPMDANEYPTSESLAQALEGVSHLPDDLRSVRPANWSITQGLRVFGWTHIYNVPALLYWLRKGSLGREQVGQGQTAGE